MRRANAGPSSATVVAAPPDAAPARAESARVALALADASLADAVVSDAGIAAGEGDPSRWPFVAHAVERCYVDRLARSDYLADWVAAGGIERGIPAGDPVPSLALSLPSWGPREGAQGHDRARDAVTRALASPGSHVMDCTLQARAQDPPHALGAIPYAVYLPEDYLRNPRRNRGVLVMIPGGRGDRTRWFLTAKPGSLFERGTGGLSLRTHLDRWASEHPGAATPIVVTVDGPTGAWIDGRVEFIGRDLPAHVAATYLPQQRERETPFAVQSISIGAAFTMRAVRRDPARFASIALMGMFCDRKGLLPERDLAPDPEGFYRSLADRVRSGALAVRLSIGRRDTLYECNKRWYSSLQRAGVFARAEQPEYEQCDAGTAASSATCWARWPGFTVIPRLGHHYAAVVPIFVEDLRWQLDRLSALAR